MSTRRAGLSMVCATVLAGAISACERERIEVADTAILAGTQPDAEGVPMFSTPDAAADVDAERLCGPPPTVSACGPCPNGYVVENDESTCTCCE